MKDKRHIKSFNEATENLNISDVSCRCSQIKEISIKRVKELEGLKQYARDQFSLGVIESQIKYWKELQ